MIASPGPPGASLSLRYGRSARARDAAFALIAAAALALGTGVWYHQRVNDVHWSWILLGWAAAWGLLLPPLAGFRWRSHVRADAEGVTLMRPRGRVRQELRWEDVEGYARLGEAGVELRGAGKTLRVSDDFERAGEVLRRARDRCLARIVAGLVERRHRGDVSVLRVPASRAWAHAGYGVVTLAWAAATAFLLFVARGDRVLGAVVGLCFWSWVFIHLRWDLAWRGGWIRIEQDGLVLRRLDDAWTLRWEDIVRIRDGRLERRNGRTIGLHPNFMNLEALERLVSGLP